jgi:predicted transcriptional regulator
MKKNIVTVYKMVEKNLKFLTSSGLRNKIILSLSDGVKGLEAIKSETGSDSSTIIHAVRDMEQERLVIETKEGYHLTPIGKILSLKLLDLVKTLHTLEEHQDFWMNHDINGIPDEFLERIHEVKEYDIISSSPKNIWRSFSMYLELVRKAKEFRGVSPIFHPDFVTIVEKLAKRKIDINIIITEDILDSILKALDTRQRNDLLETLKTNNFCLWITDLNPRVAFTVTNSILSLALFLKDGTFDTSHNLISKHNQSLKWGRELFNYYLKRSRRVIPQQIAP